MLPPNAPVITVDLLDALIVSTYNRRIGTVVLVRCQPGLSLVGPSTVTCMQSGFWSADPYCKSKYIVSLSKESGKYILSECMCM